MFHFKAYPLCFKKISFSQQNNGALVSGQPTKLMYVMHNSEYPLSCFALFENGPSVIADANFDVLMVKLKSFFHNAKGNKMESRGTRYRYCDFLVKVGTVTMGPSARGISVEVRMSLKFRKLKHYGLCIGTRMR